MNLVLGIYNGYNSIVTAKGGIYFFLKSLRKYNTSCKVIILCEKKFLIDDLVSLCSMTNVDIYTDFDLEKVPIYEDCMPNIENDRFIGKFVALNQRYRYTLFNKIIKNLGLPFNKILLSDVSDVIFQSDPFEIDTGSHLYCAAEKNILSDVNNDSSWLNMNWIMGYQLLDGFNIENFEGMPVLCCGTIIGNHKSILDYLNYYDEINEFRFLNDQGILNVYVHNFQRNDIKVIPYEESRILTLDKFKFDELIKNEDGKIINTKGEIYSIIHQIDRCNFPYMLSLC